jgi:hypothetical protein
VPLLSRVTRANLDLLQNHFVPAGTLFATKPARQLRPLRGWQYHLPFKPVGDERTKLAISLNLIAVSFLIGHELAHVNKGHLEFLEQNFGLTSVAEFGANVTGSKKTGLSMSLLQALELDADDDGISRALKAAIGIDPSAPLDYSFRLWLFALAALFLLFEASTANPSRFSDLLVKFRALPDHPSGFLRFTSAMILARAKLQLSLSGVPSDSHDDLERSFSKAERSVVQEAQRIVSLLGIEERYKRFWKGNAGADLDRSKNILNAAVPDLDRCSAAIRDHYFSRGQRVSAATDKAQADDPYHLRGQYIVYYDEDGTEHRKEFT